MVDIGNVSSFEIFKIVLYIETFMSLRNPETNSHVLLEVYTLYTYINHIQYNILLFTDHILYLWWHIDHIRLPLLWYIDYLALFVTFSVMFCFAIVSVPMVSLPHSVFWCSVCHSQCSNVQFATFHVLMFSLPHSVF